MLSCRFFGRFLDRVRPSIVFKSYCGGSQLSQNTTGRNGFETVTFNQTGNLLGAQSTWVEALQGRGSLQDSLECLAQVAGADLVGVTKCTISNRETTRIAVFDKSAGQLFSPRRWNCYTTDIMGSAAKGSAPGSVWMRSEAEDVELLKVRRANSNTAEPKEVISITLENQDDTLTAIEFQYSLYPRPSGVTAVKLMAHHVSQAWQNRLPGVSSVPTIRAIDDDLCEPEILSKPILTHENPFNLSKTEFRICLLIRSGAKTKSIAETLGSQEKTVRGQLSSIYSKIGVKGQMALLHRLIGASDAQETLVQAKEHTQH